MGDFEQSNSETNQGKKPNLTRKEVYDKINVRVDAEERNKKNKLALYNNYGTIKYTMNGATDRLLGRYSLFELEKKSNFSDGDLRSYFYGYYERGSRNLEIYCVGKVPDYINKKELLMAAGYGNDEEITKEKIQLAIKTMLTKIGYRDRQDPNVIYDKLPTAVKNNPYYKAGYNMTVKENSTKGRK